jgi:hypothetical protein
MPRSTIANRVGKVFDKNLELYDIATAAISATTNGTPLAIDATRYLDYDVVINPVAYTGFVAGTAQWSISIAAATTVGGTYNTVGTIVLDGTATQRFIALSGVMIGGVTPLTQFLRVTATKTGTPGNLQFGAFLSDNSD